MLASRQMTCVACDPMNRNVCTLARLHLSGSQSRLDALLEVAMPWRRRSVCKEGLVIGDVADEGISSTTMRWIEDVLRVHARGVPREGGVHFTVSGVGGVGVGERRGWMVPS